MVLFRSRRRRLNNWLFWLLVRREALMKCTVWAFSVRQENMIVIINFIVDVEKLS
jgi:hypothetical protein